MGEHVSDHERFARLLFLDREAAEYIASRVFEALLQVVKDPEAVTNILVAVFKHDVDLAGGALRLNEIDQVGQAPAKASAVLAVEHHLLGNRRSPIFLHETIVRQRAGQTHGQLVPNKSDEVVNQGHRPLIRPAGKLALAGLEFSRMKDAEVVPLLKLRQPLIESLPLIRGTDEAGHHHVRCGAMGRRLIKIGCEDHSTPSRFLALALPERFFASRPESSVQNKHMNLLLNFGRSERI